MIKPKGQIFDDELKIIVELKDSGPPGQDGKDGQPGQPGKDGQPGLGVNTLGMYYFSVIDGDLIVRYDDDTVPPEFYIDDNGVLTYIIRHEGV